MKDRGRPIAWLNAEAEIGNLRIGVVITRFGNPDRADVAPTAADKHVQSGVHAVASAFVDRHRDITAVQSVVAGDQHRRNRQIEPGQLLCRVERGIAECFVHKLLFIVHWNRTRIGQPSCKRSIEQVTRFRVNYTDGDGDLRLTAVTGKRDGRDFSSDNRIHAERLTEPFNRGKVQRRGQAFVLDAGQKLFARQDRVAVQLGELDHERVGRQAAHIAAAVAGRISEI